MGNCEVIVLSLYGKTVNLPSFRLGLDTSEFGNINDGFQDRL